MSDNKKQDTKLSTPAHGALTEAQLVSRRGALGAAAAALAAGVGLRSGTTEAQGCTDSDAGRFADGVGRGRRCRDFHHRCTDSDAGRFADGVGHGRRCRGPRHHPCTDSDVGRFADGVGRGRRC